MSDVKVYDNGTCTIGARCICDDNGCAKPSTNNMGYEVIDRLDENSIQILIEPSGDMLNRIKDDVTVIEGNMSDAVGRRTLKVNAKYIRGYGAPKYFTGNNTKPVNNNAHSVDNNLNIGDIVQLTDNAIYFNGASIPSWVKKMKLYVRGFRKDGKDSN